MQPALDSEMILRIDAFIEQAPDAMFAKDLQGRYLMANRRSRECFGLHREQILGRRDDEIFSATQAEAFRHNDLKVIQSGMPLQFEEQARYVSGGTVSQVEKFPVRDATGHVVASGGVVHDIIARARAEEASEAAEQRFRQMSGKDLTLDRQRVEHFILPAFGAMIGSFDASLPDGSMFLSSGGAQIIGVGSQPMTLSSAQWLALVHPDDLDKRNQAVRDHVKGKCRNIDVEYRVLHPDGSIVWVWSLGRAQFDDNGRAVRLMGALIDITDQKRIQEQELAQQRLTAAIADVQHRFLSDSNPRDVMEVLLGYLISLTGSSFGLVGEVLLDDTDQPSLKTHAISNIAWGDEWRSLHANKEPSLEWREVHTLLGHVMTTQRPRISNDLASEPRSGDNPPAHPPLTSFMGLPLLRGTQMLGMVCVANRDGGYDDALVSHLEPLLSTCTQILVAIRTENARRRMEEALRESEQRYRRWLN